MAKTAVAKVDLGLVDASGVGSVVCAGEAFDFDALPSHAQDSLKERNLVELTDSVEAVEPDEVPEPDADEVPVDLTPDPDAAPGDHDYTPPPQVPDSDDDADADDDEDDK